MSEIATSGLRFYHVDEIASHEPVAQMHGDRRVGVHCRILEWNADRFISYTKYDPGLILARHAHKSDSFVFVIDGAVDVGSRHCPAGTLIVLDKHIFFGPLVAGPDGCTILEAYGDDVTSVHEDDAEYQRMLAARGIASLTSKG